MGYGYDMRGRLSCDHCGAANGDTRKRPCPAGYCPAAALCRVCNAQVRTVGVLVSGRRLTWKEIHKGCQAKHDAYAAEETRREALQRAGTPVRCSALGYHDGTGRVRVLFDFYAPGGVRETVGYDMATATYYAIPLLAVATPDDYRALGAIASTLNGFADMHRAHS